MLSLFIVVWLFEIWGPGVQWVYFQVGFFCSFPELYCHLLRCDPFYREVQRAPVFEECVPIDLPKVRKQYGTIRINCVDCLDRTNTAAFVIGKCALGLQVSFAAISGFLLSCFLANYKTRAFSSLLQASIDFSVFRLML